MMKQFASKQMLEDNILLHFCPRILYGMRKRRLRPRNPEQKEHKLWARVLRAVAAYFRQKMHFISPKGIVYILYEFAQQGIFPGAAFVGSTFGSKELVNHGEPQLHICYETTISYGFVCVVFEHIKNHAAFLAGGSSRPRGEDLFRATRRIRRHLSSLSNRALVLLAVLLARSLEHCSCHRLNYVLFIFFRGPN